jgi:hypothetical protein
MYIKRKIIFHEECMVTYRIIVLFGITLWHGGARTADPIKVALDDGCSRTFFIRNKSEVDVEIWVKREIFYKRPDKTTFTTVARSPKTRVRSGKKGTMIVYAPDCWGGNECAKKKFTHQQHNESDVRVCSLKCSFDGRIVQKCIKVAPLILESDGKTLTVEPLSEESEHNGCAQ